MVKAYYAKRAIGRVGLQAKWATAHASIALQGGQGVSPQLPLRLRRPPSAKNVTGQSPRHLRRADRQGRTYDPYGPYAPMDPEAV